MGPDPQEQLNQILRRALVRLEKAYDQVLKIQPYNSDSEKLKLLIELTREQVPHENSCPPTRQTR